MWVWTAAFFLLGLSLGRCTQKEKLSNRMEIPAADFYEKLQFGKIMFVYFEHQVSPAISLFLVEMEKSAEVLQDYGVLVGKVNCQTEMVPTYCTEERLQHTAFLFRGGKEFLSFDLDTIFDVNSIVAEVLFAILREEVKYVHTDADLLAMERTARGKKDIVLSYVQSLGTQEHRSIMETAYVYGSKHQFILITGGPVLKQLGVNESSRSSGVWFLHCRVSAGLPAPTASERCPSTRMRRALSTLSLHSFLQLMEAPLVSEVDVDPSSVPPPQFPYQLTPQVFLFSRPATEHLDRDAATALAWRLRGVALVLLVHRQSPAVKTPEEFNAAYRLPEKSSEVKYLTSHSLDEVSDILDQEDEEDEEEEEEEEDESQFGKLDDEVAASVFENRGNPMDLDSITHLTSENFHTEVASSRLTVVLFYLKWDAVSMAFLSSFIEVAEKLAESEVDDVQMSAVDCGEWTDLCAAQPGAPVPFQPITEFPSVVLLRPQESPQYYKYMLGSEALHRFIVQSRAAAPVRLSSQEEVMSFLQEVPRGALAGNKPDRVLGLFGTQTEASTFLEAAKSLRGEVLSGLLTDGPAEKWAAAHGLDLPAVLAFPYWRTPAHPSVLPASSCAAELLAHVRTAMLHPMPELTVENLPSFLSLGKALLLLFVGEEEDEIGRRQNQELLEEMRRVVEVGGARAEPYLACWIHLGRTPAGMSVLGSYLGYMPPLPALVLAHLPTGEEVYRYPADSVVAASSVLQWLQRIQDGAEPPAGMLGADSWPPSADFYDFLKVMEAQEPPTPADEEEELEEEDSYGEEPVTDGSPDLTPRIHSEL
ncbi:thioredoxin domain-containing protein 16 isoform X2 [Oryzias melastigma]|uniref:Thioredoxin domain containing 16 n=1 Tax=Oryzias melastigma TaxID=30732 RepID=A0A3B3D1N3_ORYME|nr:thioredoxin domain-containing protein 16 isoform X2 [Oryzias melastigma]